MCYVNSAKEITTEKMVDLPALLTTSCNSFQSGQSQRTHDACGLGPRVSKRPPHYVRKGWVVLQEATERQTLHQI